MNPTQHCEYCGHSFEPTIRFRQKFCCNSCRVLYSRHKCNRAQYELKRVNQKQVKETKIAPILPTSKTKEATTKTPITDIKKLLRHFENKFLGELCSPNDLAQSNLLRQLTEAKDSPDATKQEVSLLTMILQKLEAICQNNEGHEKVKISLKPQATELLESYLS